MKKIIFSFLGILMLGMSGCLKPGENVQTLYLPGIIVFDFTTFQLMLATSAGLFFAPDLQHYSDITEGDIVLVEFDIDHNNQPYSDYFVASDLRILEKINMTMPWKSTEGGSDDFDLPILFVNTDWSDAVVYNGMVIFFFIFNHNIASDQEIDYQMTYAVDESEMVPTAYIRAKKVGQIIESDQIVERIQAFNMTNLLSEMKSYEKTYFNIMYNKGGEDVDFESWLGNPVRTE